LPGPELNFAIRVAALCAPWTLDLFGAVTKDYHPSTMRATMIAARSVRAAVSNSLMTVFFA
jgi:hypothetical protein